MTRDKIRLNALDETEYADANSTSYPVITQHRSEGRSNAFREAARTYWKPETPKPKVRMSRKTQLACRLDDSNTEAALAKRTAARLDEYDAIMKPIIDALNKAKEPRRSNPLATTNGLGIRPVESGTRSEPSRDPRLEGRNA